MVMTYKVLITDPHTHLIQVKCDISLKKKERELIVYFKQKGKNTELIRFVPSLKNGEMLNFIKTSENQFKIDLPKNCETIKIDYVLFGGSIEPKNLFVLTEFSHLPHDQVFLCVEGMEEEKREVTFDFYQGWSKLNTLLKDISKKRNQFHYTASSQKELFRSSSELGCYESDGFMIQKVPHHLLFQGSFAGKISELKESAIQLLECLGEYTGKLPYQNFKIFTLLNDQIQGHSSYSDGVMIYQKSLRLKTKEGANLWTRILSRGMIESCLLNIFDEEDLGWWRVGLTRYLSDKLVLKHGAITKQQYLKTLEKIMERYLDNPGKKFQTLEDAYQKPGKDLNYHLDIKSKSYLYCLFADLLLHEKGSDLLYVLEGKHPETLLKDQCSKKDFNSFELLYSTSEEVNLNTYLERGGLSYQREKISKLYIGVHLDVIKDRVYIKRIDLDSPAYKAGLCPQDEILAFDGIRVLGKDLKAMSNLESIERLLISRMGNISQIEVQSARKNQGRGKLSYSKEKGAFIQEVAL